jgi:carbamoyltransferase
MVILGINPGIDSTAALVVDGRIVAVAEEERLSRIKMHLGFPRRAIREVLKLGGVSPSEIEAVTWSFGDYLRAHPLITRFLLRDGGVPFDPENPLQLGRVAKAVWENSSVSDYFPLSFSKAAEHNRSRNHALYLGELRALGIDVPALVAVDHHVSHAASAYFTSGFDECLVVTADGSGDGASITASVGRAGELSEILRIPASHSAGVFYASITAHLGFKAHRHEGKITGLAAFGDPNVCRPVLERCLRLGPDGRSIESDFADPPGLTRLGYLSRLFGGGRFFRVPIMNAYADYYRTALAAHSKEDIAAGAQGRLEEVMVGLVRGLLRETGQRRVALAGGVFANVKLNQRIFELGLDEIFIHPNMGDGGNATGGALHHAAAVARQRGRPMMPCTLQHVYLGASFGPQEIESALRSHGLPFTRHVDIEDLIGEKVARGVVVGRFNGAMEYGPRALGNRSILAHPGDRRINDILNKRLRRTEFMPFAPSALDEDSDEFFDLEPGARHAAEFMTITCNVQEARRQEIAAVVHVDGTARPHLVKKHINPSYHRILTAFKRHTGLGTFVNTSFNIHEEPIICTPDDACRAFTQGAVDVLAIGDFMVGSETASPGPTTERPHRR